MYNYFQGTSRSVKECRQGTAKIVQIKRMRHDIIKIQDTGGEH